jgi:tRNA threonylcarbamoyladenosine biosynthesis protein TsaE
MNDAERGTEANAARGLFLPDEDATEALGAALAALTPPGGTWLLWGELGAGKTSWARGFVAGLGGEPGQVSSPTYAILHRYGTPKGGVLHLDLYRLGLGGAWGLGLEDCLAPSDRLVVEWAGPEERGPWPTPWVSFLELRHAPDGRLAAWGGPAAGA